MFTSNILISLLAVSSLMCSLTSHSGSVLSDTVDKPSLVCTYRLNYQPDSTDKTIRSEYFKLLIGAGISRFQSAASRSRDSLIEVMFSPATFKQSEVTSAYTSQLMRTPVPPFTYSIYKKEATGETTYYDWIGRHLYSYQEPSIKLNWVLSSKKSTVGGFACQQATTDFAGRHYEAWFTREVAVSDGPYKFRGLPGLIVKVQDTRKQYDFELVRLTKSKNPVSITLPEKSVKASAAAIRKGQDDYQHRQEVAALQMNPSVGVEMRKRYVKQHNNSLELR